MHIIGIFEIIVQVYFAVHAGRTGRYWWIFIILFFPVVGTIIYFFVEYLPEVNMASKIRQARKPSKPKNINHLIRELEITDSIKNRMNLAEAYFHRGEFEKSIDLLEKSLNGINANDLNLLKGLSYSHYHNGTCDKAVQYLNQYEKADGSLPSGLRLLRAKANAQMGKTDAALDEYQAILNLSSGEEARCRYALLLKKKGDFKKANELFAGILKNAELYPKQYSKFEKEWVRIAKKEMTA